MSVRSKLNIGFGSVVALAVIVQVILLVNLAGVKNSLERFDAVEVKLLQLANNIRYYDAILTDAVRAIILDPTNKSLRDAYDSNATILDGIIQEVQAKVTTNEEQQLFKDLGDLNDKLWDIELGILANPNVEDAVRLYAG